MRNRNQKLNEYSKHVIAKSPYDHMGWEEVILICGVCKKPLTPWPIAFKYDHGEIMYDDRGRVHNLIEHGIKKHPCLQKQIEEKRISEEELMSGKIQVIQKRLDEIYAEPKPVFRVNQWVINVKSGHLWQLNEHDLEVVTEGYKNGQRNVMPYE